MTDSEHIKLHLKEDRDRAIKAGKTRSKFSEDDAKLIANEYKDGCITQSELAQKYNCSQSLIANIINKKRICYGKEV